jgi:protocatechuate 3,4-dioxygenase beta subunit
MTDRDRLDRRRLLGLGLALPLGALLTPVRSLAASCGLTPRQTSGPFFPLWDQIDKDVDLTKLLGHDRAAAGTVLRVEGRVLDERCRPVPRALVDLWQADSNGRYSHPADPNPARRDPNFQGWGQAVTDRDGRYAFRTIKPAAYPTEFLDGRADESAGWRTPHIHFRVSKRGYQEFSTQMYFAGEALNEKDAVLARVPREDWRKVIAEARVDAAEQPPTYAFDITIASA